MIKMPWNNETAPNVMLEVTNSCNLSCQACYKKKGTSFKTLEEIEEDLEAGLRLRPLHTVTISGGEPTLHPGLCQIVELVKKRGVHVFLLTNGVLIDQEYLQKLKSSGLDSILFHVDTGQKRPDLSGTDHAAVKQRLSELTSMAVSCELDVSISSTLYDDGIEALREISRFFFDSPDISFLYISRGMDPQNPLSADKDSTESPKEIEKFLKETYGIMPFAHISSSNNKRMIWISYFVPTIYQKNKRKLFRIKSNIVDLLLMKMQKFISGKYIHKTTQKPGLTLFRVIINGLTTFRPLQLVHFLGSLMHQSSYLKHKMIAYDDGPRLSKSGKIEHCEYCPTAIVRNGELLTCCTADYSLATESV